MPSARVGLPEVKLGICPGAGGTQRLPRLVGIEKAIDMIASGDPIPAAKAAELGVIDQIIDGDLREGTIAFARELLSGNAELVKVRDRNDLLTADPDVFETARKTWAKKKRGFEAPQRCIDAVEAAATRSFDEGMRIEREIIEELMASAQSRAQRHFFFAERQANKIPDVPKDTALRDISKAAILGAGTMGGGIAMNFANAGIPTVIVEQSQEALDRGLGIIRRNYENTAKARPHHRRCRSSSAWPASRDRSILTPPSRTPTSSSRRCFENMALKKEIFGKLDAACKPGCILATNTSTLDVDEIAACTSRPQDVIGLHFFSPANVMRLLEEVRGKATAQGRHCHLHGAGQAHRQGAGDGRRLPRLRRQPDAAQLFQPGVFAALRRLPAAGCRRRALCPRAGHGAVRDVRPRGSRCELAHPAGNRREIAHRRPICEMGRFGQKTGGGYYDYREGSRTPVPNDEVARIVEEEGIRKHNHRRSIDREEIVDRCMLALVNEGAKILEEGIAMRASDIDVVYVYGYGYPVYRGGPMCWADEMGLPKVLEKIRAFHAAGHGDAVWSPAPLIERLVAEGKSFRDYDKG